MDLNKIRKMTDQERTAELERMKQELSCKNERS